MSDSEVAGGSDPSGSVAGDAEPEPLVRRGRRRPAAEAGPLRVFAILVSPEGRWGGMKKFDVECAWPDVAAGSVLVVGLALAAFHMVGTEHPENEHHRAMHDSCSQRARVRVWGFVDYPVSLVAELVEPVLAELHNVADVLGSGGEVLVRQASASVRKATCSEIRDEMRGRAARPGIFALELDRCFALHIVLGACPNLHSVAITQRTARRHLLDSEPPPRQLRAFVRQARTSIAPEDRSMKRFQGLHALQMTKPRHVIEWLDASKYIKQVRLTGTAAHAFGKIFARSAGVSRSRLISSMDTPEYKQMRMQRIRLDIIAMHAFRHFWRTTLATAGDRLLQCFIMCDASPTVRGQELWAATIDIWDGRNLVRRLLPCLCLASGFLDTFGKGVALVWQLILSCGPDFGHVRSLLNSCRAVVSDMGVERGIADLPSLLHEVYGAVWPGFTIPRGHEDIQGGQLFPAAMQSPGWKHQMDLVLRDSLCSLRWFPNFLKILKALSGFLRVHTWTHKLQEHYKNNGMPGIAQMIGQTLPPGFAEWRWGTLAAVLRAVAPVLHTLQASFPFALFRNSRDGGKLESIAQGFRFQPWYTWQWEFATFMADHITELSNWGSGCACHEDELQESGATSVKCWLKGRRVHEAWDKITSVRGSMSQVASEWTSLGLGCSFIELGELQGTVRLVHVLLDRKFLYLSRIPYLLLRLPEAGVRDECIRQWLSADAASHHRVSREFLEDGSPMRQSIDDMHPDGSGMSDLLAEAVRGLRLMPFP